MDELQTVHKNWILQVVHNLFYIDILKFKIQTIIQTVDHFIVHKKTRELKFFLVKFAHQEFKN